MLGVYHLGGEGAVSMADLMTYDVGNGREKESEAAARKERKKEARKEGSEHSRR